MNKMAAKTNHTGDDSDSDDDFVSIGTAVPQLDQDEPLKKPTAVQDLTAKDKQGRRRFHGAFTGGFSAGFFNTVGTKEGFTPSAFVSSRSQKHDAASASRPEDFMDDEDFEEHGIAPRKFATQGHFTSEERKRKREADLTLGEPSGPLDLGTTLLNLISPQQLPIGMKLLRKMGWREGQGIGPRKVKKKKKAKPSQKGIKVYGCALPPTEDSDDSDDFVPENMSEVTFAPQDMTPLPLDVKTDTHGLGYSGLNPSLALPGSSYTSMFSSTAVRSSLGKKGIRGQAFGVGAFEDDDDDIYAVDNMSNYDIALQEGDVEDKNFGWTAPRQHGKQSVPVHYVGKLLEGFSLSAKPTPKKKKFPAPELPRNFRPIHWFRKKRNVVPEDPSQQMTAVDRGLMLGEAPIMNSVFDLVPREGKERISATQEAIAMTKSLQGSEDQSEPTHRKADADRPGAPSSLNSKFKPAGMSSVTEAAPAASSSSAEAGQSESSRPRFVGSMSIQPFRKDPAKQARYDRYLALVKQGDKDPFSIVCDPLMTEWEKGREKEEFSKAAKIFRPLSAIMSTRFVNSVTMIDEQMETSVNEKSEVSDETKAAEMKMFGKLTRTETEWHPDKLLCRRFNVPNPYPSSDIVGVPTVKRDKFSVFDFLSIGDYQPKEDPTLRRDTREEKQEEMKRELVPPKKSKMTLASVFDVLDDPKFHKPGVFKLNKDLDEQTPSHSATSQAVARHADQDTAGTAQTAGQKDGADNSEEDEDKAENTAPSQDLFRAIFKNSDSEDSEVSDEETEVKEEKESSGEEETREGVTQVKSPKTPPTPPGEDWGEGNGGAVSQIGPPATTSSSSPSAVPGTIFFKTEPQESVNVVENEKENDDDEDEDDDAYGPKLPESFTVSPAAPAPPVPSTADISRNVTRDRTRSDSQSSREEDNGRKHRSRERKHKKEKRKKSKHKKKEKKQKKHRHSSKKSKSRRSESSGSESDSSDGGGNTDSQLLDKLKQVSKNGLSYKSLTRR